MARALLLPHQMQEVPEGRVRSRVQKPFLTSGQLPPQIQPRLDPIRRTCDSCPITPNLLFGLIAFPCIATCAGRGCDQGRDGPLGVLHQPSYCGERTIPCKEDCHLPVSSSGPSFGGHSVAGWPWPSGCLPEESLGGAGRLILMGCDLGRWGGGSIADLA